MAQRACEWERGASTATDGDLSTDSPKNFEGYKGGAGMRHPCANEPGNPWIPESTIGLLRRWAMRQESGSCVGNRGKRGGVACVNTKY